MRSSARGFDLCALDDEPTPGGRVLLRTTLLALGFVLAAGCSSDSESASPGVDGVPDTPDVAGTGDTANSDTATSDDSGTDDAGSDVEPEGTKALVNPNGAGLFDAPWPTDLRRREDGSLDLSGFPDPKDVVLVQTYLNEAQKLNGYSIAPAFYIRFDAPIAVDSITSQVQSGEPGSNVILVDIDKNSRYFGRRYPVRAEWSGPETTYLPANTLKLQIHFGTPLSEATTYALLLTTGVKDAAGQNIVQPNIIQIGRAHV